MPKRVKDFILQSIVFNPAWLSEHRLRTKVKRIISSTEIDAKAKWIDVGCGLRPYEVCFPAGVYAGVDVECSGRENDQKNPDYYFDGVTLPFGNANFEGAISTQVLEHVPNPLHMLKEMHRVIKPNGLLILSIPFVWQEHEEPYDYFRYTQFGVTELLKQAGFEIESITKDTGTIETLAMLVNTYVIHNLVPPVRGLSRVAALAICFPVQVIALLFQRALPDKRQLYLNLVVRARKTDTNESASK